MRAPDLGGGDRPRDAPTRAGMVESACHRDAHGRSGCDVRDAAGRRAQPRPCHHCRSRPSRAFHDRGGDPFMTVSTMPVTACSPVAGWLLPTPSNTRNRLEGGVFRKDVFAKEATDERRARPLRRLGVVARQALIEETEAKLRMVLGD